jgi:peptidoglycan/LPS O-acetylase OafA/YrhL
MRSPGDSNASRAPQLDALRIIAAIAVVVLHYAEYTKDNAAARFVFDHVQHFNLFVDLFFVISGFVIAKQYVARVDSHEGVVRFLWRRIARIYPLHLLTLAFYLAIAFALQLGVARGENPARYPLTDIPAQLLMLHALVGERLTFNFPSWSLSAEMFCYALFPLLAAAGARRRSSVVVLLLALVVANSVCAVALRDGPWTDWINRGGVFRALPSFALGVGLYLYRDEVGSWPQVRLPLTPLLLVFLLLGSAAPATIALALVYAIAAIAVRADIIGQETLLSQSRVGRGSDLTYSIYMLHIPVATVVLTIGGRMLQPYLADARLALVPVALATLALASHLCFRHFETPVRHFLYTVYDRRSAARLTLRATAQGSDSR